MELLRKIRIDKLMIKTYEDIVDICLLGETTLKKIASARLTARSLGNSPIIYLCICFFVP